MIPLKLHIKNFLSYGSPTQSIDFNPYHLICLSGKNGHGKSALLDALTWAVWGQARKGLGTNKADEGLIRLGQTHMAVALDFTCNGQNYRVRREFTYERGKGVTQLDFGIIDATGTLHELTDKTIKATQTKLEQTIGFDYESFINSVFLRQGNSNEFSKKSPKERKEVLATILGLGKYELLRRQAVEKVREGMMNSGHIKKSCELLAAETASAEHHREQLAQLMMHITQLAAQEQACNATLHAISLEKKNLQEQLHLVQHQCFVVEQLTKTMTSNKQKISDLFAAWRTVARELRAQRLPHAQPFDDAYKQNLERELHDFQKKIQKRLTATHDMMHAATALQTLKTTLHHEHYEQQQQQLQLYHALTTKLHVVQAELATTQQTMHELAQQQEQLTAELTSMPDAVQCTQKKAELAQQELLFERRKVMYHAWVNRGNKLAPELKKITLQLQQLTTNKQTHCPLCEQSLLNAQIAIVHNRLLPQERWMQHQLQRLARCIPELKQLLTHQHQQLAQLKEEVAQATNAAHRAETTNAQLEQIKKNCSIKESMLRQQQATQERLLKELDLAQKQKDILNIPLEALLIGNGTYRTLQQTVKQCEQILTDSAYDEQRYEQVQQLHAASTTYQNKQQELMQQLSLQEQRTTEIHALCAETRRLRTELAALSDALATYEQVQQHYRAAEQEERNIAEKLQVIAQQKELGAHQRGSLEQACLRIAQQEALLAREQMELVRVEQDTQEYQLLAQALSKDGIQGLLIENVIPEIESEANDLLARLTNNQAHLSIESIRDLKSGGTKETLEIKIADAVGVRPYELFSGGEAFRIDFALRLAVSKLLARRSGTSLQTLIIDEGFGSQDEEGLNHIMESLYSIQEDFAKIIIVSHLPAMKDQFPVHFTISKTPRGSTVQVIEQG